MRTHRRFDAFSKQKKKADYNSAVPLQNNGRTTEGGVVMLARDTHN